MFDSPIAPCPICGEMVLLDQTQFECAREHHCRSETPCPLNKLFTGLDFSAALTKESLREQGY
ncbi:MAG: hypothetical protein M0Z99_15250 [Betaproteobacteria bacterium]|nr:hypothetical protein [Betaproteobacteria bacterium]